MYLTHGVCTVQGPSALQEPPYPKVCRLSPLGVGKESPFIPTAKGSKGQLRALGSEVLWASTSPGT